METIGRVSASLKATVCMEAWIRFLCEWSTEYLKENPKGGSEICKVIEDMHNQERKGTVMESAKKLMKKVLDNKQQLWLRAT